MLGGAVPSVRAGARQGCSVPSSAALARLPTHGVVAGDMNGDGRADRLSLAVDGRARLACRYVLVADLGSSILTTFVRQPEIDIQIGLPRLAELARVNRGRGSQAIVGFSGGAYVEAYGLYDISHGHIVRMRVLSPDLVTFPNAFGAGASVAFGQVTICADGPGKGRILEVALGHMQSTWKMVAAMSGALYVQRGESYRLVSATHRLTAAERRSVWTKPPRAAPRAEAFANCAIASTR
jgi:hypothetical protein